MYADIVFCIQLGWRPLLASTSVPRRILNFVYLVIIVGCIVASYVIKIIGCERDTDPDTDLDNNSSHAYLTCPHLVTVFIVPESIHFLAYVYLFYHYRIQETEQLSSLIETVRTFFKPMTRETQLDIHSVVWESQLCRCPM